MEDERLALEKTVKLLGSDPGPLLLQTCQLATGYCASGISVIHCGHENRFG